MPSRRGILLLILLFLGLNFGVHHFLGRPEPPVGWKVERWEAGFGSWGAGGFGVAYDIAMPREYALTQKCGIAWITGDDEDSPEDFRVKLSFAPTSEAQESEFAEYMNSDAAHAAYYLGRTAADIAVGAPAPFAVGALRFQRRDLILPRANIDRGSETAPARGFYLAGERLAIVADLQGEASAEVNERIVGSLRRVRGVGFTDLLIGAIPNLLGC